MNIQELQSKFEDLIKLLEISIAEAENNNKQSKLNFETEESNNNKLKELASKEESLKKQKETLNGEKDFIKKIALEADRRNKNNELREKELDSREAEIKKLKEEVEKLQDLATDNINEKNRLALLEKDLADREAMIEREKVIDKERKTMLDMKEKNLDQRAARLQNIIP